MRVLLVLFESGGSRPVAPAGSTTQGPAASGSADVASGDTASGDVASTGASALASFDRALQRAGVLLTHGRLARNQSDACVTFAGGRAQVAATSRADTAGNACAHAYAGDACAHAYAGDACAHAYAGDAYVGDARAYWLLQVASRDEALAWASRCPAGAGGRLAVWPVRDEPERPATA